MPLVTYSDSETSEVEEAIPAQVNLKSASASSKSSFRKVVDRSNPHKITVQLSESTKNLSAEAGAQEPPSKRARLSAGSSGDFNSFLPAPKRNGASRVTPSAHNVGKNSSLDKHSLRTGSFPSFDGDIPSTVLPTVNPINDGISPNEDTDVEGTRAVSSQVIPEESVLHHSEKENLQNKGKSTMFKPLSVIQKPKKKKAEHAIGKEHRDIGSRPTDTGSKKLLFSLESNNNIGSRLDSGYRPMLYGSAQDLDRGFNGHGGQAEESFSLNDDQELDGGLPSHSEIPLDEPSQSLDTIAADLKLSASDKRQLFGRHRNKAQSVSIVNFDTAQEYAANELARQAGEQAQHNPVRSIAPGKHSLKQLVSAASHQKDALEEHFASGKRNKREAGSKYGW